MTHKELTAQITVLGKQNLTVTPADLEISHFSHGHGGQNVNRHMSGVRLKWVIPETHRLPYKKTREIIATSYVSRHQHHNLVDAFEKLIRKINEYFYVKPLRKSTRVPKGQKERRLNAKRHRKSIKQARRGGDIDL